MYGKSDVNDLEARYVRFFFEQKKNLENFFLFKKRSSRTPVPLLLLPLQSSPISNAKHP